MKTEYHSPEGWRKKESLNVLYLIGGAEEFLFEVSEGQAQS